MLSVNKKKNLPPAWKFKVIATDAKDTAVDIRELSQKTGISEHSLYYHSSRTEKTSFVCKGVYVEKIQRKSPGATP